MSAGSGSSGGIKAVQAWLHTQGYALEYEAARHLAKVGFRARQGRTYIDPNTEKVREIDVEALCLLTTSPLELYVVVECKFSKQPWLVRKVVIPSGERRWVPIATPNATDTINSAEGALRPIVIGPDDQAIGMSVDVAFGREDSAYSTVQQAISAATGVIAKSKRAALALPVVVLDGELFDVFYDPAGSEHVGAIRSARLPWQATPEPTVVDIVTRAAFEEHAKTLQFELGELADHLREAGLEFSSEVFEALAAGAKRLARGPCRLPGPKESRSPSVSLSRRSGRTEPGR